MKETKHLNETGLINGIMGCQSSYCRHTTCVIYCNKYVEVDDGYAIKICNNCFLSGIVRIR